MRIIFYLFDDFETLDLFGPVEVLCRIPDAEVEYCSCNGGIIVSAQKTSINTKKLDDSVKDSLFLIPGGRGTRSLVKNETEKNTIKKACELCRWCLSVCTGSAVLASCGVLDGKTATSNKKAFDWVCSCSTKVLWQKIPRFCKDGKFYTSAGVSAGIDMSFEFIKDNYGIELAHQIACDIEYEIN